MHYIKHERNISIICSSFLGYRVLALSARSIPIQSRFDNNTETITNCFPFCLYHCALKCYVCSLLFEVSDLHHCELYEVTLPCKSYQTSSKLIDPGNQYHENEIYVIYI